MSKQEEKATRLHNILDRVIAKFSNEDEVEVSLAEATMEDGTVISYENMEVGTAVMVIPEEGDPTPAPDGEYPISETETIVVSEGVIAEVKVEEAPEEVAVEEEEEVKEELEEEVETNTPEDVFNMDSLKEKIDFSKEGFHTITFSISNGKIEWGNLYSESFQELSEQKTELEKEIETMKAKFEEDLKLLGETIKSSGIVQAPVEQKVKQSFTKADIIAQRLEEQRKEKSIY